MDKEVLQHVAKNIRAARLKNNITQKQLAEKGRFETASMRSIESGKTNMAISTLTVIAGALQINIRQLFD